MRDSRVRHVGDVQQTVDSAEVNKRTKVGDVLDDTNANLTFDQFGKQFLLCVLAFFFDQATTADNNVSSLVVDLEDFALHDATNVFSDIARTTNVDLRGRKENRNANVDQQSTFDFSDTGTGNDVSLFDFGDDRDPVNDMVSFSFANRNQTGAV